ncbi:hypothetical protein [Hymenobacter wooponensis]|uniref:Uncharacterized protein n=1 Tax=Hymenobacter wooponensis TaxID=1525360 RepID=A0A4Z0MBT3_9BACT|nr:hypothetical protein [Hymenobacter wooponensis]TGD76808.1 hypothetical protein EU557_25215 [Hymenobacter wooponensis]
MSCSALPCPALTTAAMLRLLRLLRLEMLQLPATSPYREVRLRRLTDQFTYIVQTWAGLPWPTISRQGDEVPSQVQVLHQLTHLPTEPGDQQKALLVLALLLT